MGGYVLQAKAREPQPVPRARGAKMAVVIGPEDGAPNFIKRRFVLESGGRIPAHFHEAIEHEQFIVSGEMTMGLDDETVTARAGDVVFIPAKTVHWYQNDTAEPCEFLCTIPITDDYTTEWLEEL